MKEEEKCMRCNTNKAEHEVELGKKKYKLVKNVIEFI